MSITTTPVEGQDPNGSDADVQWAVGAWRQRLALHTALLEFIEQNLTAKFDYGSIPRGEGNQATKEVLLLPGAEKIAWFMGWRAEYDVIGDPGVTFAEYGTITIRCRLIDIVGGEEVGQGLGSCSIKEYPVSHTDRNPKSSAYHSATIFGEKRAYVKAVRTAAALSARFTQDEDIIKRGVRDRRQQAAQGAATAPPGAARASQQVQSAANGAADKAVSAQRSRYQRLRTQSKLSQDSIMDLIAQAGGGKKFDALTHAELVALNNALDAYISQNGL